MAARHSGQSGLTRRGLLGRGLVAVGVALLPRVALADPWASDGVTRARTWVKTISGDVSIRSAPQLGAERLSLVRSGTVLRIVDAVDQWKQVYDPHADISGYVHSGLLEPADEPAKYVYLPDLPIESELSTVVIATADVPVYFYPSDDPRAQATIVEQSGREVIVGTVTGEDGAIWYKTQDRYYLLQDDLFIGAAPFDFSGRWLDVSLTGAAHVVAYEENAALRSFYAIKGTARYPTPPGTWSIVRRVANETMDSTTVGIPRTAPGGYYLKNVLYTQYFRGSGESLHYNWWSSAWGLPGSHGCLGLSLADSRWLWEWATIGTPVSIHA